jgi:uncharacterized membrane protein HdeD (DUF308 family)
MSTMLDEATKTVETQLTKMRWALGLNGLLLVAFGVVILFWPGISVYALTILFGAYCLASGIIACASAFSSDAAGERGWLVFYGILGIIVGVVCFAWTGMSALALLYVIGAYAIVGGVILIGGAFWLPLSGGDTALMILTGVVAIVFGIVIFAKPGTGVLVTLALIAAYALVTGIAEMAVAIGGKRILESSVKRTFEPKPQTLSY